MKKIKHHSKPKDVESSTESKKYIAFGIVFGVILLATGIALSYLLV